MILNHSTDGVSCETSLNIHNIMKYLEGNTNHFSFPDTNHNVKKFRYQLVGGSCAAIICVYCFDTWIINIACVEKYLIQVE